MQTEPAIRCGRNVVTPKSSSTNHFAIWFVFSNKDIFRTGFHSILASVLSDIILGLVSSQLLKNTVKNRTTSENFFFEEPNQSRQLHAPCLMYFPISCPSPSSSSPKKHFDFFSHVSFIVVCRSCSCCCCFFVEVAFTHFNPDANATESSSVSFFSWFHRSWFACWRFRLFKLITRFWYWTRLKISVENVQLNYVLTVIFIVG